MSDYRMARLKKFPITAIVLSCSIDELVKIHGAFEAEDAFYQVMERCDRNLYEILHQEDGFHFTEEEVCNDVRLFGLIW